MPQADQATIDLLTDYFDAMEVQGLRPARLLLRRQHHPDLRQRADHHRPRHHARTAWTTLLGKVKSLAHPLINVWQEDGGVVIFEVTSIWRLHDDSEVKINACSIFTLVDGKFTDQRIYVDNAPVDSLLNEAEIGLQPDPGALASVAGLQPKHVALAVDDEP